MSETSPSTEANWLSSPAPSSSDVPPSRPIACWRCRESKQGCSKERPRCSRCRDRNEQCVYEEAGRKITINESLFRELQAKATHYEALKSSQAQSSPRAIPTRPGPSRSDDFENIEDKLPLIEPFTHLNLSVSGTSSVNFKGGPESADNFFRGFWRLSGIYGDDSSLDTNAKLYDPEALPSRRINVEEGVMLPPIDMARHLFAVHYTYIGTIFYFTNPETFETLLLKAYRGIPDVSDKEARLAHAKLLMILAFGQLYSINQWVDFKGPPGFPYFTAALSLLPEPHEEGSILAVETLAYVGYFMQNMNRRDAAYLYIGMALRMAVSLGLHQEVAGPGLDDTTKEYRRRVWWSIYSLDRIVSVKSGNPLTIQDEDIGVSMPSRLSSEPEYCPAVVLRHYTELSRILGEVTSSIYRKTAKSGSHLMSSVRSIMISLSKWHCEIPEGLRFDPAKLRISRESVSTFLHYYQCINMTARPLLFHVVQRRLKSNAGSASTERDWKIGLSQTTISVIEMCISAAEDTINMMKVAAQLDLVATYGYMDGEHAFSAAIVLVMVCGAFPTNPSTVQAMNSGLELLRGMAKRGNRHMGARYELLAQLKSILMPNVNVPDRSMLLSPAELSQGPTPSAATSHIATEQNSWETNERLQDQGMMMLGSVPNVGGSEWENSGAFVFKPPVEIPMLPPLVNYGLHETFFETESLLASNSSYDNDFMLWEEGFADPAGHDPTQWMHATQMVVDGSVDTESTWEEHQSGGKSSLGADAAWGQD